MSEITEQSDAYSPHEYRKPFSNKVEATEFNDGDGLDFQKKSPHVGPVIDTLNKITPFEKPLSRAEQSVVYIASVGANLALVRRDYTDKNWSLGEEAGHATSHLFDNEQKAA